MGASCTCRWSTTLTGEYFALRVARHLLFLPEVSSGVHAAAVLLNYGQDHRE